ncbi:MULTISPECIES: DUF6436 domain-containing protein [Alteromonadaceae]|uniref:DUF6436 domain-containing protein n=1 Tax=Alteromonadaceae TaxID=72275 RepID=UPI001C096D3F|nr:MULTISPECIES: DUF6436 domain-containing protein [Aliiglaciecola]MBU2878636.1 hypothetical protein [Aliiglaciecola lipolytica]MDO6709535.1 DUF6436 domain-containing protein [Aliiglaciecola sp. 2_MG-2023]MDO6750923.1 DUF6436 domain-containing protein [Aliiglaciecola sp. 1_MG-2023]
MTIKGILAVIMWAGASLFALFYFAQNKVTSFDPQQSLLLASMSQDFDDKVKSVFSGALQPINNTVFHIQGGSCSCNKLSQTHIRKLNITFAENGYKVQTIDPKNNANLKKLIPSYPAVVIFDESGNLGYLGPYSTGYLCSSRTSLIEPIAKTIVANNHLGATVVTDGEGCYCQS